MDSNALTTLTHRFETVSIDRLVKADWNYKRDDSFMLDKLVENIKRNGQVENLIVRELETGALEIVNGNHRYDALRQLGIGEAIVCNLGRITLLQAQRIAIETNETRFKSDVILLAQRLEELRAEFEEADLTATLPFTDDDLNNLSNLNDYDWDDAKERGEKAESDAESDPNIYTLTFRVPFEVQALWIEWKARMEARGINYEPRMLELALVEALNTPEESVS
jgi:ParB-like chromosome segregation protein Spo0J